MFFTDNTLKSFFIHHRTDNLCWHTILRQARFLTPQSAQTCMDNFSWDIFRLRRGLLLPRKCVLVDIVPNRCSLHMHRNRILVHSFFLVMFPVVKSFSS